MKRIKPTPTIKEFLDSWIEPTISGICSKYKSGKTVKKHIEARLKVWNEQISEYWNPGAIQPVKYKLTVAYSCICQGEAPNTYWVTHISLDLHFRDMGGGYRWITGRSFTCAL